MAFTGDGGTFEGVEGSAASKDNLTEGVPGVLPASCSGDTLATFPACGVATFSALSKSSNADKDGNCKLAGGN